MHFYALAEVPARMHPWWLNFLMHWSFLLELLTMMLGACVMFSIRKKKKDTHLSSTRRKNP